MKNYYIWSAHTKIASESCNMWDVVSGTETIPVDIIMLPESTSINKAGGPQFVEEEEHRKDYGQRESPLLQ